MGAAWYRANGELRRRWRATLLLVLLVGLAGGAVLDDRRRRPPLGQRLRALPRGDPGVGSRRGVVDGPPVDGGHRGAGRRGAGAARRSRRLGRIDFPFIVPAGSGFYPYLDFLAAVQRRRAATTPSTGPASSMAACPTPRGRRDGDHRHLRRRVRAARRRPGDVRVVRAGADRAPVHHRRRRAPRRAALQLRRHGDPRRADVPERELGRLPAARVPAARVREGARRGGGHLPGWLLALRLHGGAADVDAVTEALREMFAGDPARDHPGDARSTGRSSRASTSSSPRWPCARSWRRWRASSPSPRRMARHFAAEGSSVRMACRPGDDPLRAGRLADRHGRARRRRSARVVAVASSILASPLMPVGVARRAEPDPGVDVDVAVVVGGFVADRHRRDARCPWPRPSPPSGGRGPPQTRCRRPGPRARCGRCGARASPAGHDRGGHGARAARRHRVRPCDPRCWAWSSAPWAWSPWWCSSPAPTRLEAVPARYGSPFDALVAGFSGDVLEDGGGELLDDPDVERGGAGGRRLGPRRRSGGEHAHLRVPQGRHGAHAARRARASGRRRGRAGHLHARERGRRVGRRGRDRGPGGLAARDRRRDGGLPGGRRAERSRAGRAARARGLRADLRTGRDQRRRAHRLGRRRRSLDRQRGAGRSHGDRGVRAAAAVGREQPAGGRGAAACPGRLPRPARRAGRRPRARVDRADASRTWPCSARSGSTVTSSARLCSGRRRPSA